MLDYSESNMTNKKIIINKERERGRVHPKKIIKREREREREEIEYLGWLVVHLISLPLEWSQPNKLQAPIQ